MSSMPPAATSMPLARRTAAGVIVDDRFVRIAWQWRDFVSKDGEQVDIDVAVQAGCVDTVADRQLLAERLLSDASVLQPDAIERLFADEAKPAVARVLGITGSAGLLDGSDVASVRQVIEGELQRVGFSAGLRIASPLHVGIDSPSVRRARDAERARRNLATFSADTDARAAAIDELTASLADGCDGQRLQRAASRLDPLDLLRAVGRADVGWSAAQPTLWLVVGDRLIGVDPTRPDLARQPLMVSGVGPLRSARGATIDGRLHLLAGGRGGVAVLDARGTSARRFLYPGGGEFGFNASCFLADRRVLLATHSEHGLVRWRYDDPDRPAERIDLGPSPKGGRSLVAVDDDLAVLVDGEGALLRVSSLDDAATPIGASASPICDIATLDARRVITADADRHISIIHPHDPVGGPITRTRIATSVSGLAALELCGVPRAMVVGDDGAILLIDPASGAAAVLNAERWPARAMRSRPGFAAILSVDRMRIGLIDLSTPDRPPVDLHVAALVGRRVADLTFA